jgi:hypothetical protein
MSFCFFGQEGARAIQFPNPYNNASPFLYEEGVTTSVQNIEARQDEKSFICFIFCQKVWKSGEEEG